MQSLRSAQNGGLKGIVIRHPLSPWLYFRRNPGRTLPVAFVITVSVSLVASVVSLVDSIDLTIMTMYGYQRYLTVVTPRNALEVDPKIVEGIRKQPLTREIFTTRPAFTVVKTIFGKMPYVVFGLNPDARRRLMDRIGLRLKTGRLPIDGKPELALSVEIARNLHLKLGDVVLKPDSEDSYSIVPMRLCGMFEGPVWLSMTSESFIESHFPLSPRGQIILAGTQQEQRELDRALAKSVDKAHARVWTFASLVRETSEGLASLYLIMSMVIAIIVFAIAFLVGMLANIYFTQRLPEFATLAAIGYQRTSLLLRVLGETGLLCVLGWALGSLLTIAILWSIRETIMTPRGLLLDPFDFAAYRFTIPLPLTIAAFATVGVGRRLRALDPVAIIERRQ